MEVVALRTLTYKSLLKFGIYTDCTVQQVFDLDEESYLIWVYFNLDRITFIDEILDIIIPDLEYRIDKPSKNPELGDEYIQKIKSERVSIGKSKIEEDGDFTGYGKYLRNLKDRKFKQRNKELAREKFNSKKYLQRKNQGHK